MRHKSRLVSVEFANRDGTIATSKPQRDKFTEEVCPLHQGEGPEAAVSVLARHGNRLNCSYLIGLSGTGPAESHPLRISRSIPNPRRLQLVRYG